MLSFDYGTLCQEYSLNSLQDNVGRLELSTAIYSLVSPLHREEDIEASIYEVCGLEPRGSNTPAANIEREMEREDRPRIQPRGADGGYEELETIDRTCIQPQGPDGRHDYEPYVPLPIPPRQREVAGKKTSPRQSSSDSERSDDEMEGDGEGEDVILNFKEVQRLARELFEGNESVEKGELLGLIEEEREGDVNKDETSFTRKRLELLVKTGIFIDEGRGFFRNGFEALYKKKIPRIERIWQKSIDVEMKNTPYRLRWLTMQVILAYSEEWNNRLKRNRVVFRSNVFSTVQKFKNTNLENQTYLDILVEFSNTMTGKKPKRIDRVGDLMSDSDREGSVASSSSNRKRKSSHTFAPPYPPKTSRRHDDSSGAAVNGYPELQRLAFEAIQRRSPTKELSPTTQRRVNFKDSSPPPRDADGASSVCSDTSHRSKRSSGSRRSDRDSVGAPFTANSPPALNRPTIHIDRTALEPTEGDKKNNKPLYSTKWNKYISTASKRVIDSFITRSFEETKQFQVTFKDTLKSFVGSITFSALNRTCLSSSEILSRLRDFARNSDPANREEDRMDALILTTRLLSLVERSGSLVSIEWRELEHWAVEYSKTILRALTDCETNLVESGKMGDVEAIKKCFDPVVHKIDTEITKNHGSMISLFRKMANINEHALYILFGVNIKKGKDPNDEGTITSDHLLKYIFLIWVKRKKSILELKDQEDKEKDVPVYWSIPLAYAIELHGIGRATVEEEAGSAEVSLEDFLSSAEISN